MAARNVPSLYSARRMVVPALWYKYQFLLEKEPSADPADLGYKLTKAAEEAQRAVGASVTLYDCSSLNAPLA